VPKDGKRPVRLRPSRRRTGWGYNRLLLLLSALTIAVTVGLQLSGLFEHTPAWLPIVLYSATAVLAMATVLLGSRSRELQEDAKWAQQIHELLALHPEQDGQLPRLSTLSSYKLGTTESRYGDDGHRGRDLYVHREIDERLDEALSEKPFVLIIGDALAGKSRTAYEAARRLTRDGVQHDPVVLVPRNAAAVEKILHLDPPLDWPKPALLWLDDLTEGELADLSDVLDRLGNRVIVLGNITAQRHERVTYSDSSIGRDARLVLKRAHKVRLEADLTDRELSEARASYPDEEFKAGIGEQLVAADVLLDRYDDARQGAEPHGWAIVQAAIDWVRMDIGRPIRQSELAAQYPLYLAVVRPNTEPQSDLTVPLEWACKPVSSHLALLQRHHAYGGEPSFLPFGYLVAIADGQHDRRPQPIPDSAWDQLPSLATPDEVLRAATSAYYRNLPKPTQRLLQAVIDIGHVESAGIAAFNLGVLLAKEGDIPGAQAAYRQAIDIGHTESAGIAAHNLGMLLAKEGDIPGAQAAYRQAIDIGHTESAGEAAFKLGVLLEEQGDIPGAQTLFRQAIDIGHTEWVGIAALSLGVLLAKEGDIPGAQDAYRQAIDIGHTEWAGIAALSLGVLLEEQGDIPGAKASYRQAIDIGHTESAGEAAFKLGVLLAKEGDIPGAQTAYRQAIDIGHAESAGEAAFSLGLLFAKEGDIPGAKAAYRQAIDIGHAESAGTAALALGVLLQDQGDISGAKAAYRQAIDSGDPVASSVAAHLLGNL
jgi:tetratricopeptide (TPR) repeat protein